MKTVETQKTVQETVQETEEHDHSCGCIWSDEFFIPNVDGYDSLIIRDRKVDIRDYFSSKTMNHLSNFTNYTGSLEEINRNPSFKALESSGSMEVQQVIYYLHHGDWGGNIVGLRGGSGSGGNASNNYLPGGLNSDAPVFTSADGKKSFIDGVYDVDDLFAYMDSLTVKYGDSSKYRVKSDDTKISREQLINIIHDNEDFEDSNFDFFGSINRVFYYLDTIKGDNDGYLSRNEINMLIEDEIGELKDYSAKVREFNNKIQLYYEGLSNQNKFEFAVDRVKEYFEAVGFQKQLDALNRLYNSTEDKHNSGGIGSGQMWMYTPDKPNEGGAYGAHWSWLGYNNSATSGKDDYAFIYYDDADTSSSDYGLNLNKTFLTGHWYMLVDVLVHELTHATAWLYYPTSGTDYTNQVNQLFSVGVIDEAERDFYLANMTSISEDIQKRSAGQAAVNNLKITAAANSKHENDIAYLRLLYLITCQYTEYMAYQVDDDYMDSIAGDVYIEAGAGSGVIATGDKEDEAIKSWINKNYDTQLSGMKVAEPDYNGFFSYHNLDTFRSYFA